MRIAPPLLLLLFISIFSLTSATAQSQLKYISLAPDGTADVTIIDDLKNNILKLESINNFYKYQLLDSKTSEPVLSASNKGKACFIDKSAIMSGAYNLRLFTQKFVITIEIILSGQEKIMRSTALALAD